MIYAIRGILSFVEPFDSGYTLVVDCNGISYEIRTTYTTVQQSPSVGQEIELFTHLQLREDGMELFGFFSQEEKRCFLLLTSVSGIGPRNALSILSGLSPEQLALAIASGDTHSLVTCKGIGAKSAQRILLELKDKFTDLEIQSGIAQAGVPVTAASGPSAEAISALTALGYSKTEAAGAIAKLPADLSVEEMIKQSLRTLSSFK